MSLLILMMTIVLFSPILLPLAACLGGVILGPTENRCDECVNG